MATNGNPGFDVPAEMRAFAEKSMEQAKTALDTFMYAAPHAVNTAETQSKSAQSGARGVGELAMQFAERNMASSFDFAQRLMKAKDVKDVAALHAEYEKILEILRKVNFNKSKAAMMLNIDRKTLYNKMKTFNLLVNS